MTHICVSKLTIIGSDNGLSPGRRQAIIWTNAGILLNRPLRTNFNEILIEILTFSFIKMRLKVSSAKWRPFCLGLNVLTHSCVCLHTMPQFIQSQANKAKKNRKILQSESFTWKKMALNTYFVDSYSALCYLLRCVLNEDERPSVFQLMFFLVYEKSLIRDI